MGRGRGGANRPTSETEFLELVSGLYDTVMRPALWQAWLERLCRILHAPVGAMFLRFRPGPAAGYFSVGVREDLRGWMFREPAGDPRRVGIPIDLGPGDFAIVSEVGPRRLFLRSRFHREWMRPQGLRHCVAGFMERSAHAVAGLGVMRREGSRAFGEAEVDLLRRLAPHVQRSIRLLAVRGLSGVEREAAQRIGDALRLGALFVTGSGQILAASRRAAALLEAPSGPHLKDGRLVARTPAETRAFRELIAAATQPRAASKPAAGGALALTRPGDRPPLLVLVSPLRGEQGEPGWTVPSLALVLLRAPEDVPVPSHSELRSLFALTPAEARVACLLPERTVEEIARDLAVRVATVRTHVQHLLAKTGARRQTDLVRLLVSGPWLGG
jgi:DNA-binding CsgD family transcriptional regulator